jgi:NitT/TauT family transport system substrate-binding protein
VIARRSLLAGAASVLAVGAGMRARHVAAADELPKLRVLRAAVEFSAGVQYAQNLGLFKKYGVDVDIAVVSSGEAAAAAIVGGTADIGAANVVSLVLAHEKNIGFTFVAPGAEYVAKAPTSALIVAKSSPLRGPRDFAGKTMGVIALGDINTIAIRAWLEASGVDAKSVRFIELPNPQMAAAIDRGAIDAAIISSPALAPALQTGRILGLPYSAISDHFAINAWYARKDWVAAHRDTVARFTKAVTEAQLWANANHAESAKMLVADAKLDPDLVATMTRATYAPKLDDSLIQPLIDLMAKDGRIAAAFPASDLYVTF